MFDEQQDGDIHGECAAEIQRLQGMEAHYKQRLRDLLPYAKHKVDCSYTIWQIAELFQKQRGPNYSAGKAAPCSCNLTVLQFILIAELEIEPAPTSTTTLAEKL